MKRFFLGLLAVSMISFSVSAQEINVVWEYFNISEDSPLPILKPSPRDTRTIGNAGFATGGPLNGRSLMDTYGGFKRYDEERLLLGIRENGIDEGDPNHDAELAAQFPDRSLIWINPADGSPMGIALVIGHRPYPVSDEFVQLQIQNGRALNGEVGPAEYFNFGVSDDGVIYVGYFYYILRYEPDGQGGFTGPEVAYAFNNGENPGLDNWDQWRFEDIEVTGSGSDTVIVAAGKTWRPSQRVHVLETEDGLTFSRRGNIFGDGGGASSLLIYEGDDFVYNAQYPGTGGGSGNTFKRFFWSGDEWLEDPLFTVELNEDADGIAESRGDWIHDIEAHPAFPDLIFALGSPAYGGDTPTPGFINIYSQDFFGEPAQLLAWHRHNVTRESQEMLDNHPIWYGTMGNLDINVLPGFAPGSAEILWYSGIYGYGRYTIGDTGLTDWTVY